MKASMVLLALTLGVGLTARPARAESAAEAGPTAAETLFEEGRRLMEIGQYAAACAKFRESQRLDSGAGTLMNLGRCYAKQGLSASAWAMYRQAASLAQAAGQVDRERVARREIAALELELAKVTISVLAEARALEPRLTLDGAELAAELWDVSTPIDPGEHELFASLPDGRTWSLRFSVAPREIKSIQVPAPAPASKSQPGAAPSRSPRAGQKPSPAVERPAPKTSPSPAFWVSAATGAASLAVGTVAGVLSLNSYESAESLCTSHRNCSDAAINASERAEHQANVANVAFGVALVAVAASIWLYASGASEPPHAR